MEVVVASTLWHGSSRSHLLPLNLVSKWVR